jgi:hypothetical protein
MTAPLRFPLLALGIASLFFAMWAGLLRFGWNLHVGLIVRIGADLAGDYDLAHWGGLLNTVAIGLFFVATVASAALARRTRTARAAAPAPLRHPAGVAR